jgi:hypothetical protein
MEKKLHIIAFDIPYPPNYGGVIDVFYKIKSLSESGIKITLHCFEYNRVHAPELEKYCETVYYYKRQTGLLSNLSLQPYIVLSRKNKNLIDNLLLDSSPILFEGLHSCYYLNDKRLKSRFKIYRESNIEHVYYFHLFLAQKNPIKSVYFLIESIRLQLFQRKLKAANLILAVSKKDASYLQRCFPLIKVIFLPSFHANTQVTAEEGIGNYVLYHGNLSVQENEKAVIFLLKNVFNDLPVRFVIAGLQPSMRLKTWIAKYPHAELYDSPNEQTMNNLIRNAHIHTLITFQQTGLKLKLINVLYSGRFCLCNTPMLWGTDLEQLCEVANSAIEMKAAVMRLLNERFSYSNLENRTAVLNTIFGNKANSERIIQLIFSTHN